MVNLVPGLEPFHQEIQAEKYLPTAAFETIERIIEDSLSISDPSPAAQEPLLAQIELDLEAGIQKVAAKKAKKAKKIKEQQYLLELEIPVLGKIKIAPFYSEPKILYSSSLVGSLAAAYAIYHLKRLVRPPELTEPSQQVSKL